MSVIMNVLNTIKREGRPPQDAQKKNNPDQNSEENSNLIVGEPKPPISQGGVERVRIRRETTTRQGRGSRASFFLTEVVLFQKIKTNRLMVLVVLAVLCFIGYFGFQLTSSAVSPGGITLGGERTSGDGLTQGRQVRLGGQVLQGVIVDDEEPYCIIKGNILKTGDTWDGKEIIKIRADGVTLIDKKGEVFFISYRK